MNEKEFTELAAGHALNALSSSDERAYQEALTAHPEWMHHVRADADTVALLAETITPVNAPAEMRASLLTRIGTLQQDGVGDSVPSATRTDPGAEPAASGTPDRSRNQADRSYTRVGGGGARRLFALAASVALLVALGAGAVTVGQLVNRPAAVVALEQIQQAPDAESASVPVADGGEATAHWSASLGQAVLVTEDLPALGDDETFELWFVRDGEALSAGVFAASDGDATAELRGQFHSGDVIAVTVEPAGGAPDGQPTSEPILAITT